MERSSCFPADCSCGSLAACSRVWLGIPEAMASMAESLWLAVRQSATSRDHGLGPSGPKFDMKQDFLCGLERNFIIFHFQKGATGLDLAGLWTQIRRDPSTRCTQRTGSTLVLAYCNYRFSASVSAPLPCSSPRQLSVQLCQGLLGD